MVRNPGGKVGIHDRRSRFWAAMALFTALLPPQSLPLFVASGLSLLRPGRVTLAAAGAVCVGAGLLGVRTIHTFFLDPRVVSLFIALKLVFGIALWLLVAERTRLGLREPRWTVQATVAALGALALLHLVRGVGRAGSPLPTMELHLWARYDSGLILALLGITVALRTLDGVRARVAAVAALTTGALAFTIGTVWFRDRFGDDPLATATAPITLESLPLEPWRQHVVQGRVGDVHLSPTGSRVALRMTTDEFPGNRGAEPSTFDVEVGESHFRSFVGWDLKFTNDDLVAVLTRSGNGTAIERFRVWPEYMAVDRIELPRLSSPTLRVDASGRGWEVASTDFGMSQGILLRGQFGTEGYRQSRWTFDRPGQLNPDELRANSSSAALLLASRIDLAPIDYLTPFLPPLPSYSTLSEVSALHRARRTRLVLTTLDVWCVEPMAEQRGFVCGGNDRELTTWLWSIDAERQTVTPLGSLAGYYHDAKFARANQLLLRGHSATPVVIDLSARRALRLRPTSANDRPIDPAPPGTQRSRAGKMGASAWKPALRDTRGYEAMAKEGDVVALATFERGRSTVTVYRTTHAGQ